MAEPESEKIVKDTLNDGLENGNLIYFQKVSTPRYQPEPIDFLVVDGEGISHLIEVKESGSGNSISQSQFKDHQLDVLQSLSIGVDLAENATRAWIVARMFSGDKNRSHSGYYESYFLCPGKYCGQDIVLSVEKCSENQDCIELGGYRAGRKYGLMDDEGGLTTKGNPTRGFDNIPMIAEK